MASFHYVAANAAGASVRGRINADDRLSAMVALAAMGLEAHSLAGGRGGALRQLLSAEIGGGRAHQAALLAFTRELALLLSARIALDAALAMLIEEGGRELARLPLADVRRRVGQGELLADAMAAHPALFQPDYLGIVRVGQSSGTLPRAMADLAAMLERRAVLRGRLTGALTYPIVLLLASIGTIAVLVGVVLPSFAPLFDQAGAELPWTTRVVLAAADRAPAIGAVALAVVVAGTLLWLATGQDPAWRRMRDARALRLPVVGPILLLDALSRTLRSLGIMADGGLLLRPSLAIAAGATRNSAVSAMLDGWADALERGERLSDACRREPLMPAAVPRLIRVGEESGELGPALLHLGELLDAKLRQRLDRGVALITPALTLLVGGMIAFVLVAVMGALLGANELVVPA